MIEKLNDMAWIWIQDERYLIRESFKNKFYKKKMSYIEMSESIYKNNELENEVSSDMSYF